MEDGKFVIKNFETKKNKSFNFSFAPFYLCV